MIRTNAPGTKLIGLDGPWGSGKSNVAKIVQSTLQESHHFFFYDAWGHQEDLQRRSFLEELTADLCSCNVIESTEWNQNLKDLLARKRETLTKTIPRLSTGVIVTAFVAIFTPIAHTIADALPNSLWSTAVTSAPFLVGVLWYLIASCRAKKLLTIRQVYAIYADQQLAKETHVTISEREPSVREFQQWMMDLSVALDSKGLVIVFDNMDRLPQQKVLELWSSIHTFFAELSFDSIWVMVPFDRTHIRTIFSNDPRVPDDYLKKSFSVIYRVPPPVLTDWRYFFGLKYAEAFGEPMDEKFDLTRKIFGRLETSMTPRNIISFINELVSLRLVVEPQVDLRYIALFALTKHKLLEDPVGQILSNNYLGSAAKLFEGDEDLSQNIAALVYHVPLSSASQVALHRAMEKAVNEGGAGTIKQFADHQHFYDILDQVIGGDDLDVDNAVQAIGQLQMEDHSILSRAQSSKVWRDLADRKLASSVTDQAFTKSYEILLEKCSTGQKSALVEHFVSGLQNSTNLRGAEYYSALTALQKCIETNDLSIRVLPMLRELRVSASVFLDYIKLAKSNYKTFKLNCTQSDLETYVVEKIPDRLDEIPDLKPLRNDFNFERVVEKLKAENNGVQLDSITPFYQLYRAVSSEKPIEHMDPNAASNLLSQINDNTKIPPDLCSLRLAMGPNFPSSGGVAESILAITDKSIVDRIAPVIEYHATYHDLLMDYLRWPQPIMKAVLLELTLKRFGVSRLSITAVLQYYKQLKNSLELPTEPFIKKLNEWASYAKKNIGVENITEHVTDHEFFEDAANVDCELSRHMISTMVKYLNALDIEKWRLIFAEETNFDFRVVCCLLGAGKLRTLPDNAVTVYKELLIMTAKDEFEMGDSGWQVIYDRTHKSKLKATAKNIRDLFIAQVEINPARFLDLSGLLINHGALEQKCGDVARRILAPIAWDDNCWEVVLQNDKKFVSIVKRADHDAADFKDIVRQRLIAGNASSEFSRFAKAIGVEAEQTPT